jgi:ATP-dependent RNA helicase DDX5/DBP2
LASAKGSEADVPTIKAGKRARDEPILQDKLAKKSKQEDGSAVAVAALVAPEAFYKTHEIKIVLPRNAPDVKCPPPFQTFEHAAPSFNPRIMAAVATEGYVSPSPIQAACWPPALNGSDLIAIARTGSGKTCGFLFPAFMHITKVASPACKRGDGPVALVLAPTRELAMQIEAECQKFARTSQIVSCCAFGGMPKGPQIGKLMRGVHIIIATPGRLNDFLEMTSPPVTNLTRCDYLVLDEADRMLDMGFEPQIRSIIEQLPQDRKHQTLMFSATWPKAVKALASDFLINPIQVNIGGNGDQLVVNTDVTQEVLQLSNYEKDEKLVEIVTQINGEEGMSCIVFANKKTVCDRLASLLRRKLNIGAQAIHGDKVHTTTYHRIPPKLSMHIPPKLSSALYHLMFPKKNLSLKSRLFVYHHHYELETHLMRE